MQLWYALHSKPNMEFALWHQFRSQEFEVYFPYIRSKPINPRARTSKPYFPSYLFICVDLKITPQSIFNWAPNSLGLVCFDWEPASIPDEMIRSIKRHVDQINDQSLALNENFHRGDRVLIEGGAFEAYQAIFDAYLPSNERVRVLLQYLRDQQVKLELPQAQIRHTNRSEVVAR